MEYMGYSIGFRRANWFNTHNHLTRFNKRTTSQRKRRNKNRK